MVYLNEDGDWGRRHMFEMVVTTTFGRSFEHATQLERSKREYIIRKIALYRGFLKTSPVFSIGKTVSEKTYWGRELFDGVNWTKRSCAHGHHANSVAE